MSAIRHLVYESDGGAVETLTFDRLRTLDHGSTQRADFHVLAFVRAGRGAVSVDFEAGDLRAGDAVWIRPGAVHRWLDIGRLAGDLVLFTTEAPATAATRALAAAGDRRPVWSVPAGERPRVRAAVEHLGLETSVPAGRRAGEAAELLLSVLLGLLDPGQGTPTRGDVVFDAFRDAVEANFREHHDVGFYAGLLGYSDRTLTRAAQRRTGDGAKAYLVARVVLEAKRLLAHDRLTAARCAQRLGFGDPSNFSAFFRAHVGDLPGRWQRTVSA